MPMQMNRPHALDLRRLLWAIGVTGAFAACGGSGLGSGAWTWCKENLPAVDAAAATLHIPVVQTIVREPTWLADYQTSMQNTNTSLITANADFMSSCDAAANASSVGASRVNWCLTDGIGPTWTAAVSLNLVTETQVETFAYRGISLEQRLDNPDFVRACQYAYAPPPTPTSPTS
jgi:hypothetical protein